MIAPWPGHFNISLNSNNFFDQKFCFERFVTFMAKRLDFAKFLILLLTLEVKLEITVCALTGVHICRSTGQRSTCYIHINRIILKESDKHNC
jgi:hypothetical protein